LNLHFIRGIETGYRRFAFLMDKHSSRLMRFSGILTGLLSANVNTGNRSFLFPVFIRRNDDCALRGLDCPAYGISAPF